MSLEGHIISCYAFRLTHSFCLALVYPDCPVTYLGYERQVMAHDDNRNARSLYLLHFVQTFLLKICISDGHHLIDEKNLVVEVNGHGEAEPGVHPR